MALVELIGKLKNKKQAASRTAFSQYMSLVRDLASGAETDADEVASVLTATGRTENDLEHDVALQQKRFGWHAQLTAHKQASADRVEAERELQVAQAKLRDAIDTLTPAVDLAVSRLRMLDQAMIQTSYAEAWLAEHVLDADLRARETSVSRQLREVSDELKPLLDDRSHKVSSLVNAEGHLQRLTGRDPASWPGFGMINPRFWANQEINPAQERVDDLKNQISQLDEVIRPRQENQRRLEVEMQEIYRQKLEP